MHEKSEGHKVAVTTAAYETRPITTQLSSAVSSEALVCGALWIREVRLVDAQEMPVCV